MTLRPGTRLGPDEILSALGAGGMGEVYRARDTRLDRTVEVKMLPESLAADPQFREAVRSGPHPRGTLGLGAAVPPTKINYRGGRRPWL